MTKKRIKIGNSKFYRTVDAEMKDGKIILSPSQLKQIVNAANATKCITKKSAKTKIQNRKPSAFMQRLRTKIKRIHILPRHTKRVKRKSNGRFK